MIRDLIKGETTSFESNIKRKKEVEPPRAQAPSFRLADSTRELRTKTSTYQEERMKNIARNQENLRDIFEGKASPATSSKAVSDIEQKKEMEPPRFGSLKLDMKYNSN